MDFSWQILELFENGQKVRFLLKATNGKNTVETEGYHSFSEGVVYKPFNEIKEEDLIRWLEKDTTQDDVNIIKLNLEQQLNALENDKKVNFPWETDTFTIG